MDSKSIPDLERVEMPCITVPMVIYKDSGERFVVGEATVYEDYTMEARLNGSVRFDEEDVAVQFFAGKSGKMSFNFDKPGEVRLDVE